MPYEIVKPPSKPWDCDPYWVVHDTPRIEADQAVKGSEIHKRLASIRSSMTIAILDTQANKAFLKEFEDNPSYSLFLAVSPHQTAIEVRPDSEAPTKVHGLFTWCFAKALRQGKRLDLTPREILRDVAKESPAARLRQRISG